MSPALWMTTSAPWQTDAIDSRSRRSASNRRRFTRLNDNTILYEMKVEDPLIMVQPYTVRYPLRLDNTYEWWEYACHEGNRTIRDYINSSRAERGLPIGDTQTVPTR